MWGGELALGGAGLLCSWSAAGMVLCHPVVSPAPHSRLAGLGAPSRLCYLHLPLLHTRVGDDRFDAEHHVQLFEIESHYGAQASLELGIDPPASGSTPRITGLHHCLL